MTLYREIPAAAVAEDAPLSAYLARNIRDNIRSIDHHRQGVAAQLDETTGHLHQGSTVSASYTFADLIQVVAGVNDKINFKFKDSGYSSSSEYTATLTAGYRTPSAHASHVQAQMRAAVGSSPTPALAVTFDSTDGSPTRGFFLFRNTGTSGTRLLELLFETGTNASACAGPAMGYAKRDHKKALGYAGDSGFLQGYPMETVELGDGGTLGTSAFVDSAFITRTFTAGIIPGSAFAADSVESGVVVSGTITGDKLGAPGTDYDFAISSGGYHDFSIDMSGRTSGSDTPMVCVAGDSSSSGCVTGDLEVTSLTHGSGDTWTVRITNNSGGSLVPRISWY